MEKKEKKIKRRNVEIDPEISKEFRIYTIKKETTMRNVVNTLIKQKLEEDDSND